MLLAEGANDDPLALLGEAAHIVAENEDGPRGLSPLTREGRNHADNLLFLCHIHHQRIDDQPHTYTVANLQAIKEQHERWVETTLGRGIDGAPPPPTRVEARLHSTLLPVQQVPALVYGAPCTWSEREVARRVVWPRDDVLVPYIVRSGELLTFADLREPTGPFSRVIDPSAGREMPLLEWFSDSRLDWFIALANQALTKFLRGRGIAYDKPHRRYHFVAPAMNTPAYVTYKPLNQRSTRTAVVWQPISKAGVPRRYWYHRALSARFLKVSASGFVLALQPDLHVTTDGFQEYAARYVGSKVTRKKARWYNYELLGQVHFWRDLLSRSQPRIIFRFGGASIVIGSTLVDSVISWPGIPEAHAKAFSNVEAAEDLFSWGAFVHRNDPSEDADDVEEGDDEDDV